MGGDLCIAINCVINPDVTYPATITLRLELAPHNGDAAVGRVSLMSSESIQNLPSICYPTQFRLEDVEEFVRTLDAAHRHLRGSAVLKDHRSNRVICVSALLGRGHFVVGGTLTDMLLTASHTCQEDPCEAFDHNAINVAYDGLVFDQSDLPNVIGTLTRYIREG